MSGRYLEDTCRVLVLCATFLSLNPLYAEKVVDDAEYIVKCSDVHNLNSTALQVRPLLNYPNPSDEVKGLFGDYYIVQSQDPSTEGLLKSLPGVTYVASNPSVSIDADIESSDQLSTLDDPEQSGYTPNDPLFSYQWDRVVTGVDVAWLVSRGSPDVVVAILDSGVDTSHVDLKDNIVNGYNFLDGNCDVSDKNGHGTRIAGTIAAKIDNNEGIAGVAGDASIMPLKVVSDFGYAKRSDVINAILYSVDHGARVISISLGFQEVEQAEKTAVEYAVSRRVIVVASSGNDGISDSNHYPSSYPEVISVGATTEWDERAGFSDYGVSVDVYAPGKGVWQTLMGGGYGTGSGTSYAAPQIAGLAALILSRHPDYTSSEVSDAIIGNADTIHTDVGAILRMNAGKAVDSKPSSGVVSEMVDTRINVQVSGIEKGSISFIYDLSHPLDYTFALFDASGRMVASEHKLSGKNGQIEIGSLSQGTYFWVFSTNEGVAKGKVIFLR